MSQSKTNSGVHSPKDTARSRRVSDSQPEETGDSDTVEPACRTRKVGRGIDRREWREVSYSERLLGFYEPCEWDECFPDGPPDAGEISTVVRSCHSPTAIHRSRKPENTQQEADAHPHSRNESITTLGDLTEGESVIWENQSTPRRVIETATGPDDTARLRGPSGGEYTIEARPGSTQAYAIYPAIGLVSDIWVVTASDAIEAV
jgi:hypothetical protein